jgi:hypothetical protein
MKGEVAIPKPKASLQGKGYRWDTLSPLNLSSLALGAFHLFIQLGYRACSATTIQQQCVF